MSMVKARPVELLRRAAIRATLAPSVHNTQPWRFVLARNALDVEADWSRQLRVLDPRGRQLLISCGCAVFNARAALAALGCAPQVSRFPDAALPDLVARLTTRGGGAVSAELAALDGEVLRRHTIRRQFEDEKVPDAVVRIVVAAARAEGAELKVVDAPEHRRAAARLSQEADRIENADPAYRAELRAWTSDDPHRLDGVPAAAVPHVDGTAHDDIPLRDFDTSGAGWLPAHTGSSAQQCLLLLGTAEDDPVSWVRAGEALERVLLELTRLRYAAIPLTQVVEVARTRYALREQLGLLTYPHVLLRVGRAVATAGSRRRRLVDTICESD
jgi:Nitroreductase family